MIAPHATTSATADDASTRSVKRGGREVSGRRKTTEMVVGTGQATLDRKSEGRRRRRPSCPPRLFASQIRPQWCRSFRQKFTSNRSAFGFQALKKSACAE